MKSDLKDLMSEKNISAIVVYESNGTLTSPNMRWVATPSSKLAHRTCAIYLPTGRNVLIHGPMEKEQAGKSNMLLEDSQRYDDIVANISDSLKRDVAWLAEVLKNYGLIAQGKLIEFHTTMDSSYSEPLLKNLRKRLNVGFVNGYSYNSIQRARETKGPDEIQIIKENARKSAEVFDEVSKLLKNADASKGYLIPSNDREKVLTVGYIKQFIREKLLVRGLIDAEETIFAIGSDCSDPHNHGRNSDQIRYGSTIIMDMFPQQIGGGYFFDCTRTWFLGEVPEVIQNAYNAVKDVQEEVIPTIKVDTLGRTYHDAASVILRKKGYAVTENGIRPQTGFRHSLGHGFGFEIHEEPYLNDKSPKSKVCKGSVFTVEPGVYEPNGEYKDAAGAKHIGFGVRLEDVVWMNTDTGEPENLTKLPKELRLR